MKKKMTIISLPVTCIIFVVGIILIFTSLSIGQNAGRQAIASAGGSMDTSQYERIVNITSENYRTGGLVLALVGGFGALLSGYAFYKEI